MTELSPLAPLAAESSWPDDPLAQNLAEIGSLHRRERPAWRRCAIATMTDSKRTFVLSRAGGSWALEGRSKDDLWKSDARRSPRAPRPSQGQSRCLHCGERRRSRPASARRAANADCSLRGPEDQGRAARFPRPPHQGARSDPRSVPLFAASCSGAITPFLRRRIPGHRSAPGGNPPPARRR